MLAFFIYVDVESAEAREIAPFSFHLDEQLMISTNWSYMETGGKPASVVMKGEEVELPLKILSATTKPVNLEFHVTYGIEQIGPAKMPRGVTIEITPKNMLLKPNQDQTLKIHVKVDKNAPSNKYDIQIVAQWPEPNGFVGTSFSLPAGKDFGPDSIAVNFFPPPLKQTKDGILLTEVVCTNDYVLVLKASSNIPACISPKNVSKLIERGWAKAEQRSEFVEFMNVRFTPAKFPGLTRDMEKYAINFTEQDLESVPKVKQMLEHALSAPKMQLCDMVTLEENNPPSKYKIITLRPFSFLTQSYLISQESNQYHSWANKNLEAYQVPTLPDYHYLRYKGEVFTLTFIPLSEQEAYQRYYGIDESLLGPENTSPRLCVITDSYSYVQGDTIKISGQAKFTDPPLLMQIRFEGILVEEKIIPISEDGSFSQSVITSGTSWYHVGEYEIVVSDSKGVSYGVTFELTPRNDSSDQS
ncbi:hypothetical protein NITUZ_140082 [Candidatus Nitrosotenuis uzonensis]|uniref:Uncharacterized protein n=2 Tax=Candidatus Nitrosotenuis uzonensis TaxID=1407055 RepID=V6AQU1_9ARCH|nr:hypothetical protein NITUZ_140082 [Candidatus Nitrosotenuis uzonensis]